MSASVPTRLAIRTFSIGVLAFGAAADAQTCSPTQTQKLLASMPQAEDRFGGSGSLQIEGDRLIVGARYDLENGLETGAAYVFEFDGSQWNETQRLVASDADEGDRFGGWNALSGDTLISGSTGDSDFGESSGSAYVFQYDGSQWIQIQKLNASDEEEGDYFGRMIAMEGGTALIGAWGADGEEPDEGAVYIFQFDGNQWVETQILTASDGLQGDGFGSWMEIQGNTIAIGASYGEGNEPSCGAVYIFEHDGNQWVEVQKLTAPDGETSDIFGHAVELSGDTMVVGAAYSNMVQGAAYVFRHDGTEWALEQKLTASDGEAADVFGYCDVSGDNIVIGARWDDDNGSHAGAVYHYRFDGTTWNEETKIVSNDIEEGDSFGWSLALDGDTLLVGARNDDDFGNGTGSAYIFDLSCPITCPADVNNDGTLSPTDFTAWINAFNNNLTGCDQNTDGSCTPTDFTAWIANFNAGC
ncbi:MAG: hypothetical protein Phyf2KO_26400 [Phycisphaerales bacterium]